MGHVITIITPSDRQILDLFRVIRDNFSAQFQWKMGGAGQVIPADSPLTESVRVENSSVVDWVECNIQGMPIFYSAHRIESEVPSRPSPAVNRFHHLYSSIIFMFQSDPPMGLDQYTIIYKLVNEYLTKEILLPSISYKTQSSDIEAERSMLSAIQKSASDQIVRVNEFFIKLTNEFDSKRTALEGDFDSRLQEYEKEFAQRKEGLEQERRDLEKRRQELDDRDNTHARREKGNDLLKELQNRAQSFKISFNTRLLRAPIHLMFMILIGATFAGAAWSLYVWGKTSTDGWSAVSIFASIKTGVFTISFITAVGLYISWMNRWFDKHADAQFTTKQLEVDVNRATWAVEAALEWKRMQNEQMPDLLLSGITKNLFETNHPEAQEYSPLEAILGAASSFKISGGGGEMMFNRDGVKRVSKLQQ